MEFNYFLSNDFLCEIANDYSQAMEEMGPEDFQSWEDYRDTRITNAMEESANAWHRKHQDKPKDDDLPF